MKIFENNIYLQQHHFIYTTQQQIKQREIQKATNKEQNKARRSTLRLNTTLKQWVHSEAS